MTWKVRITGDRHDLDELTRSFSVGAVVVSKENDDSHYLECEQFKGCQTAEEVLALASGILDVLKGATRLALGGNSAIGESGVLQVHDDGSRHFYIYVTDSISLRDSLDVTIVDSQGNVVKEIHPADEVPSWLTLGLKDSSVGKVLRLWGLQHDWVNLYRIYEVIEHDVGGMDAIANQGWAPKSALRTFRRTANSPGAIGDEARHGAQTADPPATPMHLSEARALVQFLVHSWLRTK